MQAEKMNDKQIYELLQKQLNGAIHRIENAVTREVCETHRGYLQRSIERLHSRLDDIEDAITKLNIEINKKLILIAAIMGLLGVAAGGNIIMKLFSLIK